MYINLPLNIKNQYNTTDKMSEHFQLAINSFSPFGMSRMKCAAALVVEQCTRYDYNKLAFITPGIHCANNNEFPFITYKRSRAHTHTDKTNKQFTNNRID